MVPMLRDKVKMTPVGQILKKNRNPEIILIMNYLDAYNYKLYNFRIGGLKIFN